MCLAGRWACRYVALVVIVVAEFAVIVGVDVVAVFGAIAAALVQMVVVVAMDMATRQRGREGRPSKQPRSALHIQESKREKPHRSSVQSEDYDNWLISNPWGPMVAHPPAPRLAPVGCAAPPHGAARPESRGAQPAQQRGPRDGTRQSR